MDSDAALGTDGLTDAEREELAAEFLARKPSTESLRAFTEWRNAKRVKRHPFDD